MKIIISRIKYLLNNSHVSRNTIFSLVLVNLISIFISIYESWSLSEVLMLFWSQNIIIGLFSIYKLLVAKNIIFGIEEKSIHKELKKINIKSLKNFQIFMFGFKFFFFNLVYLFFFQEFINFNETFKIIIIPIGIFFLNHLFSYFNNYQKDFSEPIKFKQFTNLVFLRVLPIHIFLIFGTLLLIISFLLVGLINLITGIIISEEMIFGLLVIVFMILKALFEVLTHIISHVDSKYLDKFK